MLKKKNTAMQWENVFKGHNNVNNNVADQHAPLSCLMRSFGAFIMIL